MHNESIVTEEKVDKLAFTNIKNFYFKVPLSSKSEKTTHRIESMLENHISDKEILCRL